MGVQFPPPPPIFQFMSGMDKAHEHRIFGLFMGFSVPFERFFLPLKYALFCTVLRG